MLKEMVDGVKVYRTFNGVQCISISDLLEHFYGCDPAVNRSYKQEYTAVKAWAAAHKASEYVGYRENFSLDQATRTARNEGNTIVIVEYLS